MKFNMNNIRLLKSAIVDLDECNDSMLLENEFDENLKDYALAKKTTLIALNAISEYVANSSDDFDLRDYLDEENAKYLEEIYNDFIYYVK